MRLQLLQLLLKASQDKRFVCEEAERSLEVLTTWMAPQPLLQKLQPYVKHFNPRVRAKASVCYYNSVSRLVCSHLHILTFSGVWRNLPATLELVDITLSAIGVFCRRTNYVSERRDRYFQMGRCLLQLLF